MKLGVQTYTIRKIAKKNMDLALNLLSRKGMTKVEYARLKMDQKHIDILKRHDFEVLSIQATYHKLISQRKKIIHFCEQTGCKKVVVSVLPLSAIFGGRKALLRFSNQLNKLKDLYLLSDIEVGFHHHDFEFKKIQGQSKFDILFEHTDFELKFVIDTYWAYSKDIDLEKLIEKVGHRLMGIHLRDYENIRNKHQDTEVGYGKIDFHQVIKTARIFKPYLVIEQNTHTPIQSIEKSRKWLYENFKLDIET